jgi:hypothetical protein
MSEVTPEKILERAKVLHPDMVLDQIRIRKMVLERKSKSGASTSEVADLVHLITVLQSNLVNRIHRETFNPNRFKTGQEFLDFFREAFEN